MSPDLNTKKKPGFIRLKPVCLGKVWAAEDLAGDLGKILNPPPKTGEIWLASDRHQVTGAAGGAMHGLGLDEIMSRAGEWIMGRKGDAGFPLLLKVLNVGQWLSVQVHPDDEAAVRLEKEPWGKNEAWHVLSAEQGAEIIMGVNPKADRPAFEKAIAGKNLPSLLSRVPARKGETFHLKAGTVHATGPGLLIFEIQQASDVTYRFYDWDRPGDDGKLRELHQEKALEVMKLDGPGAPCRPLSVDSLAGKVLKLVDDEHFSLFRRDLAAGDLQTLAPGMKVLFVLSGAGGISAPGLADQPIEAGETWLIPAGLDAQELSASAPGLTVLDSRAA